MSDNPLIADMPVDTYINVISALSALKELQSGDDSGRLELSPRATFGLSLLMSCIIEAMNFEQQKQAKKRT
ncbi:hypothetical protein [Neptuniibacter sp.]|uniref:hypothetical protein n=1 Tax=Neptuniibacter sp. TaxID=1962643 RepID=UPI002621FDF0|nr:hypothetical protein [Neptuniibacter sp.]MCP4595424.1 hypothetical protein [Neptuniibacter sp.]